MRMKQETGETFRAYALRWKNTATQVEPPLMDSEYAQTFVQTCKGLYYEKLCTSVGRSFAEVIRHGEMIEDGVNTGKIRDPYAKTEESSSSTPKKFPHKKSKEGEVALVLPTSNSLPPQNNQPYQQQPYYSQQAYQ